MATDLRWIAVRSTGSPTAIHGSVRRSFDWLTLHRSSPRLASKYSIVASEESRLNAPQSVEHVMRFSAIRSRWLPAPS